MDDRNLQLLKNWNEVKAKLALIDETRDPLAAQEMELRKEIVKGIFTQPEGTENIELANGWKLKGTIKVERKVDEAALPAAVEELQKMLINTDTLIRRKPELILKNYRMLTAEQQKVLDQALEIKYGSPTLELVPPKE